MKKFAVVTGAGNGLGLAVTRSLISKGWYVYAGHDMSEGQELAELQELNPESMSAIPMDVSSEDSVQSAVKLISVYTDHIDMIIGNESVFPKCENGNIREAQDYEEMIRIYNVNALGQIRLINSFLQLLDNSQFKRLCFLSSEAGSINFCDCASSYDYYMSKAAMNMAVSIIFNRLRPEGYTFRLYHTGCISKNMNKNNQDGELGSDAAASYALSYFLHDRFEDEADQARKDDNRLVMRDWLGREWPW